MQVHEQLRTGTGQPSDVSMCIGHDDVTKISPQIPTPSESLIGSPGSHLGGTRAQTVGSLFLIGFLLVALVTWFYSGFRK